MFKKKFIQDSILNIIATSLPLLILQLFSLPVVGSKLGGDTYGLVVTLISLFTLLSFPFGNVLNNIRLLLDNEYKQNNYAGDFNILLVASIFISTILIIIGTVYYEGTFSVLNIILMIIISCLNLLREYLLVSFRLKLNYKSILMNNIILGLGYLVGTLFFYFTKYWQFIFIFGSGASLLYITRNSNLLKETLNITEIFKKTLHKSLILYSSSFLKTTLSYADKLILFPLLGPSAVSIYYTATILGKIISMIISPINSVMLSYLTQMEKMGIKKFLYIIMITSVIGVLGYIVTVLISPPLLYFLYSNWAKESIELIYITSASAIFGVLSSVIHPFILRFNNINWQLFISGTNVVTYILCTVLFFNHYGLFGFCVGVLIANILKLILMIAIFIINNLKFNIKPN
jgi:O-antigen/teichoic acid export membrane protein